MCIGNFPALSLFIILSADLIYNQQLAPFFPFSALGDNERTLLLVFSVYAAASELF
jgi:hypothetical protein